MYISLSGISWANGGGTSRMAAHLHRVIKRFFQVYSPRYRQRLRRRPIRAEKTLGHRSIVSYRHRS
jgi:hypothetical protein